jgi:hypothetical protein
MPRAHALWPLLLLWPLAASADGVDVPALGLSIASLPEGTSDPQVAELPGGYQMTVRLDKAVLRIYRESAPVPSGSDVADPDYRASLDAKFHEQVESRGQGAPTALGGHGAWMVVEATPAEPPAATAYTCVTYVIVDGHLYQMTVHASGDPRPPEFDGLVKALSGIKFEPIRRA